MSDIDIERLRDIMRRYDDGDEMSTLDLIDKDDAARFLLDLADEGGELWIEKPNDHDFGADDFCSVCGTHRKSGMKRCARSRVRVWPKEEEVTPPPDGAAVCACGEWEMRPDAFPACPNCGRVWPPKEDES